MAGDPITIPVVVMAGSNIGERLEAGPRPRPAHWREAAVPTRVLTIPGLGTRGPGHVTRVAAASPDSAACAWLPVSGFTILNRKIFEGPLSIIGE